MNNIIRIIGNRKKNILIVSVLIFIVLALKYYLTKPIYVVNGVVEIGMIVKPSLKSKAALAYNYIENPGDLIRKLKIKYGANTSFSADANFLKIQVITFSAKKSLAILNTIMTDVVASHEEIYNKIAQVILNNNKYYDSILKQQILDSRRKETHSAQENRIKTLSNKSDNLAEDLISTVAQLRWANTGVFSKKTIVLVKPALPVNKTGPDMLKYFYIWLLLSICVNIFFVILLEIGGAIKLAFI